MNTAATDKAAHLLFKARQTLQWLEELPEDCRPKTDADSYAIQAATLVHMNELPGAWKAGVSPNGPSSAAPIPASKVLPSGVLYDDPTVHLFGVEIEIAFRMGKDLPASGAPYDRAAIVNAIGAALPVIEVVESRYVDMKKVTRLEQLADFQNNAGLVLGEEKTGFLGLLNGPVPVTLKYDDETVFAETPTHPSGGDPVAPIVFLANHLAANGSYLKAGTIVTTGALTGLVYASAGKRITGTIEGLGTVTMQYPKPGTPV